MGRTLVIAVLALTGLLCAAGIGVAAYVVSRDSVAVPVTQLQPKPSSTLTPATVRRTTTHETTTARTITTTPATTVDDHGGRSGSGGGSDDNNSGHGGGGHGDDD
jgi:hypothetical protein